MNKCNYCNKESEDGYLENDTCVICNDCIHELYTKEEFDLAYEKGEVFWTTFYDGDLE